MHRDAQPAADGAVRAVGGDDVARVDLALRARGAVAEGHADAVVVPVEVDDLGAELDLGVAERDEVLEQDRLEVVLGHAGRGRGAHDGADVAARQREIARRAVGGPGERLAHPALERDVDAAGAHVALEAPAADELHRAGREDRGSREAGEGGAPLHDEGRDAEVGEGDGRGETGGAGAGDEDGHVAVFGEGHGG